MPSVNVDSLLLEDELDEERGRPHRFGYAFDVQLGTQNAGDWHELSDGGRLWRLKISAPSAFSINLIYDKFQLPPGAEFFIYNEEKSMAIGAFTEANNKPHGKFSTAPVKGSTSILEYYEPPNAKNPGIIRISKVIYGYKSLFKIGKQLGKAAGRDLPDARTQAFGDAASCNINVACSSAQPWLNEAGAVVMTLLENNTRVCSGALLNNVKQDFTPFLLTAFHCADTFNNGDLNEFEIANAETWIFMFRYQSSNCSNPSVEPPTGYTISGANFKADFLNGDMVLLELSQKPLMSYNAYFLGWSNIDTAPSSSVGIHHPQSDIKKFSKDNQSAVSDDYTDPATEREFPDDSHWLTNFDQGTVEVGSSGSPLIDQNDRVVGNLHGATNAPCSGTRKGWYGKFSLSWLGGGTSDTQLKAWLDPDNTGATTLNGTELAVNVTGPGQLVPNQSGTYTAAVTGGTGSITYAWDKQDDGSSQWVSLGGGSTKNVTAGSVSFTIRCTVTRSGMTAEGMLSVYVSGGGGVKAGDFGLPETFALRGNFPNPFNPETVIQYELPEHSAVRLQIYDQAGRIVREWNFEEFPGFKEIVWDGENSEGKAMSTGVYLYRLTAISRETGETFSASRKMLMIK